MKMQLRKFHKSFILSFLFLSVIFQPATSFASDSPLKISPASASSAIENADIIFNYFESYDFGEPIFIPTGQQTTCVSNGVCYRMYNQYYGMDLFLGTYNNEFLGLLGQVLYDFGSVSSWINVINSNIYGFWKVTCLVNEISGSNWKADLTLYSDGTLYLIWIEGDVAGLSVTGTWSVEGNSFYMETHSPSGRLSSWHGSLDSLRQNISSGTCSIAWPAGYYSSGVWSAYKQQ
jgi:hypothetical protein